MGRAGLLAVLLVLATAAPSWAVVGGRPATEPYPFAASLEKDGEHICGASLLAADRVLTAAHCVEGSRAGQLTVVLGRTDLRTRAGEEIAVASIDVHESYATDPDGGHDVAILRLGRSSAQAPIRLARPDERGLWAPRARVRVIGWGTSFFLVGPAPATLHEVDVPVVEDAACERYDSVPAYSFDARTMVCAGEETGLRDSCQGDSGGPLMARGDEGWVQVGAVSFGLGCGFPLFYGVYARVADEPLRSWIQARLPAPSARGAEPPPAEPAPAPAAASRVRVRVARKLGSARAATRRRALRLRVRTSAPVTGLRATLRRGRRVVARGRAASAAGRTTLRLPVRRARAGRHRLTLVATDAAGRSVRLTRSVRVTR